MAESKAYLVVEIPNQSRITHKRYECIPSIWVKTEDGNLVVFSFPERLEDALHTKLRVLEYNPRDNTWPELYGYVVYDTDEYEEATRKMDELKIDMIRQTTQVCNQDDEVEEIITVCNKLKEEVDLKISEANDMIRTYTRSLEYEDTELPSTSKNSHDTQIPEPIKILPIELNDETLKEKPVYKDAKKIERPRRKSTCLVSYAESSGEENDRADDSDFDPEIIDLVNNEGNNSPQPRTSGESVSVGVNNLLDHQDITMNLLDDPVHAYLYSFYVDLNESFQKMMSSCDKAADYVRKIIAERKEEVQAKQSSTIKHTETMDSIVFSSPQPLLQERVGESPEDNRWTLRYPEPGLGIIELMPFTGVYVSEEGLNKCKDIVELPNVNRKTTKFTSSLLQEVFTDEALKTCTLHGKTKNKPGLHLKATKTLITYALNYSLEKKWNKAEHKVIIECIKNKLSRSKKQEKE